MPNIGPPSNAMIMRAIASPPVISLTLIPTLQTGCSSPLKFAKFGKSVRPRAAPAAVARESVSASRSYCMRLSSELTRMFALHRSDEHSMDPILAPSITILPAEVGGRVIVTGSHGGLYPGHLVLAALASAAIFNDAGIGRDLSLIHI